RRLFTGVAPPPAAVNVGDPYGRRLAEELAGAHRAPLVTFWLRPEAGGRADGLELGPRGSTFTAAGIAIETPLLGVFNVENVLAAVASALLLDLDEDAIADGIRAVTGVAGRFEAVDEGQDFAVVVDYAHTPDALETVLRAARPLGDGRVVVVFGAGGDRDRDKRPLMGQVARKLADTVVVTNDNPRSEEPIEIVEAILQGAGTDVEVDLDRRSAIESAITGAGPGDVVVIAGKGHEQGQEVAGVVHPFDDREVAREALRARAGARGGSRSRGARSKSSRSASFAALRQTASSGGCTTTRATPGPAHSSSRSTRECASSRTRSRPERRPSFRMTRRLPSRPSRSSCVDARTRRSSRSSARQARRRRRTRSARSARR